MAPDDVRAAIDRSTLTELLARFATALDTCDWTAYRAVFTDDIDLDYSSWRPEHVGRRSADDWVARAARLFPGLSATRHALTNAVVDLDGDTARVRVNVAADHVVVGADGEAAERYTLHGFYDDRCVRTHAGWRIAGKRLVVQWSSGDREMLARAAARVTAGSPLRVAAGEGS